MRSDLYSQMYRQESYYWWHQAKRALVKNFVPHQNNLKILDIGCGTGKLIQELKQFGQVWGIDQNKNAIKFCRQRGLNNVLVDKFPQTKHLKTNFDLITCLDVLEHINNDLLALETIKKLLKKSGRAIITVPAYPWLFSYWDKILGHKRRYTQKSLGELIQKSGLKIIKVSYLYSFLLPVGILFRLIRQQLYRHKKAKSDFIEIPKPFHWLLLFLSKLEQKLLKFINLPFGLSLICIAEKS